MSGEARLTPWVLALLGPALIVNLVGFAWPLVDLAIISLREGGSGGSLSRHLSLNTWFSVLSDPFNLRLLRQTIEVALITTVLALVCSLPLALFIHRAPARWKSVLIILSISPLLISAVVRTYGWLIILGDNGFIASFIKALGAVPPPLIFNKIGLIAGLVEILMPYMILALLAGFGRLDPTLEEAASSLGASRAVVLRRIVLPLALPGILLGCMLIFVLSISAFITPKILGGGRVALLATEIYDQAVMTLNWPVAAVLSFVSLAIFGIAVTFYTRFVRRLGMA